MRQDRSIRRPEFSLLSSKNRHFNIVSNQVKISIGNLASFWARMFGNQTSFDPFFGFFQT